MIMDRLANLLLLILPRSLVRWLMPVTMMRVEWIEIHSDTWPSQVEVLPCSESCPKHFYVNSIPTVGEVASMVFDRYLAVERVDVRAISDSDWEVSVTYASMPYRERLENGDCDE